MNDKPPVRLGRKLFTLGSAILCQSIPFAFLFMGIPAILRDLDESMTTVTLYSLLLLPWGLKLLYAPFLDRVYSRRIGRRRTWILTSLLATSVLLIATALFVPAGSSPEFMALLFLMNLMLSVNETVIGAYSSDILDYAELSWAGTIKLGGTYLGMMLGGGLLLSGYASLGWKTTFLLLGGLTFLLSVPVALHREIAPAHKVTTEARLSPPSLLRFLRQPGIGWFIVVEILFSTSLYTNTQLYPPFIIDLGFTNANIGHSLMFFAYPLGFMMAALSGWIGRGFSPNKILLLSMAAGVCIHLYAWYLAGAQTVTQPQVIVLLCADMAVGCLGGVAFYTILTAVCIGPHAATGHGILGSIANVTPLFIPPLLGHLIETLGYQTTYATTASFSFLFLLTTAIIFHTRTPLLKNLDRLNESPTG